MHKTYLLEKILEYAFFTFVKTIYKQCYSLKESNLNIPLSKDRLLNIISVLSKYSSLVCYQSIPYQIEEHQENTQQTPFTLTPMFCASGSVLEHYTRLGRYCRCLQPLVQPFLEIPRLCSTSAWQSPILIYVVVNKK